MVAGGSGAGSGAFDGAFDFDDAGAFDDAGVFGAFDDAGVFGAFDDADVFDDDGRDVVGDAVDDGRDDWPERDEPDDGLLLVGSFSVNDLNMGCPIVTR